MKSRRVTGGAISGGKIPEVLLRNVLHSYPSDLIDAHKYGKLPFLRRERNSTGFNFYCCYGINIFCNNPEQLNTSSERSVLSALYGLCNLGLEATSENVSPASIRIDFHQKAPVMGDRIERRAARVTAWDATQLDEELLNILKFQVQAALKYFPPWIVGRWETEINVILKLVIWKMSVLKSQSSFGQQMLSLKYSQRTFSINKAYAFIILKICGDFWVQNIDRFSSLSPNARKFIHWADVTFDALKLTNFLVFCHNGDYPTLTERVLGLRLVSIARGPRVIGYNYMTRELLWHGFIELLGFALPLINYQYFRKKFFQAIARRPPNTSSGTLVFTVHSRCAFCNESPILPVHISCPHVFCYYCLESNRLIDMKYECPICFFSQESATPVTSKNTMKGAVS